MRFMATVAGAIALGAGCLGTGSAQNTLVVAMCERASECTVEPIHLPCDMALRDSVYEAGGFNSYAIRGCVEEAEDATCRRLEDDPWSLEACARVFPEEHAVINPFLQVDHGAENLMMCWEITRERHCGDNSLSEYFTCGVETIPCDLEPYFDCLVDSLRCVGDEPDPESWASCAPLLECRR